MLEGNFIQLSSWFQINGLAINSYKSQIVKCQTAENRGIFYFSRVLISTYVYT